MARTKPDASETPQPRQGMNARLRAKLETLFAAAVARALLSDPDDAEHQADVDRATEATLKDAGWPSRARFGPYFAWVGRLVGDVGAWVAATPNDLERLDWRRHRRRWRSRGVQTEADRRRYIDNQLLRLLDPDPREALPRHLTTRGLPTVSAIGTREVLALARADRSAGTELRRAFPTMRDILTQPVIGERYPPASGVVQMTDTLRQAVYATGRAERSAACIREIGLPVVLGVMLTQPESGCVEICRAHGVNPEYLRLWLQDSPGPSLEADVPPHLRTCGLSVRLQRNLRTIVRSVLARPQGRDAWWGDGVPAHLQEHFAQMHDGEGDPFDPYDLFTLTDLREIVRCNWAAFGSAFAHATGCGDADSATAWMAAVDPVCASLRPQSSGQPTPDEVGKLEAARGVVQRLAAALGVAVGDP